MPHENSVENTAHTSCRKGSDGMPETDPAVHHTHRRCSTLYRKMQALASCFIFIEEIFITRFSPDNTRGMFYSLHQILTFQKRSKHQAEHREVRTEPAHAPAAAASPDHPSRVQLTHYPALVFLNPIHRPGSVLPRDQTPWALEQDHLTLHSFVSPPLL